MGLSPYSVPWNQPGQAFPNLSPLCTRAYNRAMGAVRNADCRAVEHPPEIPRSAIKINLTAAEWTLSTSVLSPRFVSLWPRATAEWPSPSKPRYSCHTNGHRGQPRPWRRSIVRRSRPRTWIEPCRSSTRAQRRIRSPLKPETKPSIASFAMLQLLLSL